MKRISIHGSLLSFSFRIFANFIAFYYHLLEIEMLGLFHWFKKVFARSLGFMLTYLCFLFFSKINEQNKIINHKIKKLFHIVINN